VRREVDKTKDKSIKTKVKNNRKREMTKQTGNIKSKAPLNGSEDQMRVDSDDAALFDSIGEYMKGWLDIEDVKNDPAYSVTKEVVKDIVSDYKKNLSGNRENEKFIKEALSEEETEKRLSNEIKSIEKEIEDNQVNEIASELVKEWHEKKESKGINNKKREEISDFIKSAIESPAEEHVKNMAEVSNKVSRKGLFVRYSTLAAAAVIGAFLLIKTLLPSSDPEKLFTSYYKPFDAISPVTRSLSNNESDIYSSSIESYKTASWQKAAIGFAGILEKDPSVISAQFFLGLSQLELKNYDQAINLLSKVANGSGEYGKEAKWYLGLTYLKTGDKEKASECFKYFAGSDGFYRDRSEKILRRLK
jgi:tetratricopeptide (TPR) repeat protein